MLKEVEEWCKGKQTLQFLHHKLSSTFSHNRSNKFWNKIPFRFFFQANWQSQKACSIKRCNPNAGPDYPTCTRAAPTPQLAPQGVILYPSAPIPKWIISSIWYNRFGQGCPKPARIWKFFAKACSSTVFQLYPPPSRIRWPRNIPCLELLSQLLCLIEIPALPASLKN